MTDNHEARERAAEVNENFRPISIDAEIVTRPASPASAAIHSYLRHLRSKGIESVPEPLGIEGDEETLRYIEGESGGDGWYHQHTDAGLESAAKLLRSIHDAGKDWQPPEGTEWGAPAVDGDELVFCHGDPGPWNFVWKDQVAVGLLDWDFLHPAPRLDDVAYALRWFAPLRADEHVLEWHHFPVVPDRRDRVQTFVDAYGDLEPFDVADAAVNRMQSTNDLMLAMAEAGVEPQRTWVAEGALDLDAEEMDWIRQHRNEFNL